MFFQRSKLTFNFNFSYLQSSLVLFPFSASKIVLIKFLIGFQPGVDKFMVFVLFNFLVTLSSSSLAFWSSSTFESFIVAYLAVTMPFTLMLLYGGFLVNTGSLLSWLKWLRYLSIFRYGLNVSLVYFKISRGKVSFGTDLLLLYLRAYCFK